VSFVHKKKKKKQSKKKNNPNFVWVASPVGRKFSLLHIALLKTQPNQPHVTPVLFLKKKKGLLKQVIVFFSSYMFKDL
jgi:hypothetical protein